MWQKDGLKRTFIGNHNIKYQKDGICGKIKPGEGCLEAIPELLVFHKKV